QALRVVIFLHRFSLPWKRSISDILSRQVNNYSRFDVKVNKQFLLNQSKLDLSLIFQNLHKNNYDFYHDDANDGHNVWEPRAYVQAKLAF
ncbi:MAG: hypothetical protein ABW068_14860, partial [Candidatus Thiodiazotropha sp.]